jgi:deoxyhypusine synthase
MKKSLKDAKGSIFKESEEIAGTKIEGYDFDRGVDFRELLRKYKSSGFQAHMLSRAIEIVKKMREEGVTIFLGYTSNMVTSGNRDIIRYLVKHRLVHVLVTTAGGVEEDFIKTMKPFLTGDFRADGAELRRKGVNRAGNIYIPNDRYIEFEKFFQPVLGHFLEKQRASGQVATPSEIIDYMGSIINSEDSIYHWAHKNRIPVFCPALMDGAIGDNVYFFNFDKKQEMKIDMAKDHHELIELVMNAKETGMIILGGGVVKHSICNANMMREGAKYAVYINTAPEYDGSDSGALPEEAKSWGKIAAKGETVKVFGDATILLPLIVAGAFLDE